MADYTFTTQAERIAAKLRELYGTFGYRPYKMSKFEEYDLYVRNKEFLISDSIITFTDTDGRLMALKPDVTLSIIKNSDVDPDRSDKLFYSENVYRISGNGIRSGGTFREIMQTGLECIGRVDDYCLSEVLLLAAGSLALTGENYVLDVGQLDILFKAVDLISSDPAVQAALLKCAEEKNVHGIAEIAAKLDVENGTEKAGKAAEILAGLVGLYGKPAVILPGLGKIAEKIGCEKEFDRFVRVIEALGKTESADHVRIDFSIVSDRNYYNGIAFKGFVEGVPTRVLSGGQYDRLMEKLSKKGKAIGFAVYTDTLERIGEENENKKETVVLTYKDGDSPAEILGKAAGLAARGVSVKVISESEADVNG